MRNFLLANLILWTYPESVSTSDFFLRGRRSRDEEGETVEVFKEEAVKLQILKSGNCDNLNSRWFDLKFLGTSGVKSIQDAENRLCGVGG